MQPSVLIAPSLIPLADFGHLADEVRTLEKSGADALHLDVMDGQFVPNLTFGAPILRSLRPCTTLPFETHLMVKNPGLVIKEFVEAGSQTIIIHPEATDHLTRDLQSIRSYGVRAGVAFNPETSLDLIVNDLTLIDFILIMTVKAGFGGQPMIPSTDKIRQAVDLIQSAPHPVALAIDGGVNQQNAPDLIQAGANILVAGTAVFTGGPGSYAANIAALKGQGH